MSVVIAAVVVWLIYMGHLWLAIGVVAVAALASLAYECWRAPVVPEFDEELQAFERRHR